LIVLILLIKRANFSALESYPFLVVLATICCDTGTESSHTPGRRTGTPLLECNETFHSPFVSGQLLLRRVCSWRFQITAMQFVRCKLPDTGEILQGGISPLNNPIRKAISCSSTQ
jgi:hypothetical protein